VILLTETNTHTGENITSLSMHTRANNDGEELRQATLTTKHQCTGSPSVC